MEKVCLYIGRAEVCQTLARTALNNEYKLEYVKLAEAWMDLAEERRLFLVERGGVGLIDLQPDFKLMQCRGLTVRATSP